LVGTVQAIFPPSESQPLNLLLQDDLTRCPSVLQQAEPAFAKLKSMGSLLADTGQLDIYPSPDDSQVLIVRHLWRNLVDCGGKPSTYFGLDRLSLLGPDGEHPLLDFPLNAAAPTYLDRYAASDGPHSRIASVQWSPDQEHVLLSIQYTDARDPSAHPFKVM